MDRVARRGPLARAPGALKSHNAEKLKGGDPLRFFNIHSVALERGDSLVSPGMVCYAEKQVKPFWSSSLGQMVQFDTIIFCRTFKNYFGQFVWIEKKVTIIVTFHFMKRRLKILDDMDFFRHFENFSTIDMNIIRIQWSPSTSTPSMTCLTNSLSVTCRTVLFLRNRLPMRYVPLSTNQNCLFVLCQL